MGLCRRRGPAQAALQARDSVQSAGTGGTMSAVLQADDVAGMTRKRVGSCCRQRLPPDLLWFLVVAPGDGLIRTSGRSDKQCRAGQDTGLAAALDSSPLLMSQSAFMQDHQVLLRNPWTVSSTGACRSAFSHPRCWTVSGPWFTCSVGLPQQALA